MVAVPFPALLQIAAERQHMLPSVADTVAVGAVAFDRDRRHPPQQTRLPMDNLPSQEQVAVMGTLGKPLLLQLQLLSAAAARSPLRDRAVAVAALHTAVKPPSIEEVVMR